MQPNSAAPRSVLAGLILSARDKLNNFILLYRVLLRINLFKVFMADNMNLFDGGSQIYIVLKEPVRAYQTISIKCN